MKDHSNFNLPDYKAAVDREQTARVHRITGFMECMPPPARKGDIGAIEDGMYKDIDGVWRPMSPGLQAIYERKRNRQRKVWIKPGSFLQTWAGLLFWIESLAIGTAVWGFPLEPYFIVGATILNFFVIAPIVAFLLTVVFRIFFK
jgi:hypothetical protein